MIFIEDCDKLKLQKNRKVFAMAQSKEFEGNLTENLKKGLTELLVLSCLNKRPMHIYEILKLLDEKSDSICRIAYPYAVIYRLQNNNFITDDGKKISDNRLRAYYKITDEGREHLKNMQNEYTQFVGGMKLVLDYLAGEEPI